MKIFISWSKPRSRELATFLNEWLPKVIQGLTPFISPNIDKGSEWLGDLLTELEEEEFGIVCVTPENQKEEWLLFEAGALAKRFGKKLVAPLAIGMRTIDITGPLSHFQGTALERDDVYKLMQTINENFKDKRLTETQLEEIFELRWPALEAKIQEVIAMPIPAGEQAAERPPEDIQAEILSLVRGMQERFDDADQRETDNPILDEIEWLKQRIFPEPTPETLALAAALRPGTGRSLVNRAMGHYETSSSEDDDDKKE